MKIENLNKVIQLESGRVQINLIPKPYFLHNTIRENRTKT